MISVIVLLKGHSGCVEDLPALSASLAARKDQGMLLFLYSANS